MRGDLCAAAAVHAHLPQPVRKPRAAEGGVEAVHRGTQPTGVLPVELGQRRLLRVLVLQSASAAAAIGVDAVNREVATQVRSQCSGPSTTLLTAAPRLRGVGGPCTAQLNVETLPNLVRATLVASRGFRARKSSELRSTAWEGCAATLPNPHLGGAPAHIDPAAATGTAGRRRHTRSLPSCRATTAATPATGQVVASTLCGLGRTHAMHEVLPLPRHLPAIQNLLQIETSEKGIAGERALAHVQAPQPVE
mmetsp:Transcript_12649/g.38106  ORF Transcript_12649/g.38106 Transcript_12649/m.38106 type:complete len:250 (+) Transcript_12649:5444-6193(+)